MRELSLTDIDPETFHLRSWIEFVRPADEHNPERLLQVRRLLKTIPPVERDVIELHFFAGKNQDQIGEALHLTQQAVSHRMQRACERLAFLLDHPRLMIWEVRRDLGRVWPDAPEHMPQILAEFSQTSSQAETAKRVGLPSPRVRQHLALAATYFAASESRIAKRYAEMLARLLTHRSILCEVPVPKHERVHCDRRRAGSPARERVGAYATL